MGPSVLLQPIRLRHGMASASNISSMRAMRSRLLLRWLHASRGRPRSQTRHGIIARCRRAVTLTGPWSRHRGFIEHPMRINRHRRVGRWDFAEAGCRSLSLCRSGLDPRPPALRCSLWAALRPAASGELGCTGSSRPSRASLR